MKLLNAMQGKKMSKCDFVNLKKRDEHKTKITSKLLVEISYHDMCVIGIDILPDDGSSDIWFLIGIPDFVPNCNCLNVISSMAF